LVEGEDGEDGQIRKHAFDSDEGNDGEKGKA
jgi:hypothetical protein